jgi:hypothetical protein
LVFFVEGFVDEVEEFLAVLLVAGYSRVVEVFQGEDDAFDRSSFDFSGGEV